MTSNICSMQLYSQQFIIEKSLVWWKKTLTGFPNQLAGNNSLPKSPRCTKQSWQMYKQAFSFGLDPWAFLFGSTNQIREKSMKIPWLTKTWILQEGSTPTFSNFSELVFQVQTFFVWIALWELSYFKMKFLDNVMCGP